MSDKNLKDKIKKNRIFFEKRNAEVRYLQTRDLPVVRLISIARWRCPNTLNCGRDTSSDTPTELGPSFHL